MKLSVSDQIIIGFACGIGLGLIIYLIGSLSKLLWDELSYRKREKRRTISNPKINPDCMFCHGYIFGCEHIKQPSQCKWKCKFYYQIKKKIEKMSS